MNAQTQAPVADRWPEGPEVGEVLAELANGPAALLERLVDEHGSMVGIRFGEAGLVVVNDPELAREVLVGLAHQTEKGSALQHSRRLLGDGLLTSEGTDHARRRRIVAPAFHRPQIARYCSTIVECTAQRTQRWIDHGEIDMHVESTHLALDIVGRTLFGIDLSADASGISDALTVVLHAIGERPAFQIGAEDEPAEIQTAISHLDAVVARMIADRRIDEAGGTDLLSALVRQRDDDGVGLSDIEIRDEVMTLLLAGHETTANALAWAFGLLAEHPDIGDRLCEETRRALGEGRNASYSDLPFAKSVISEVLRMYPPAWAIGRRAIAPIELGPWRLPAGTGLVVSPWLLHRDPSSWAEPHRFDPDRWANQERVARGVFLPFGAGIRSCIGEQLAWAELILGLSTANANWRCAPTPRTSFVAEHTITMRPKHGMWLQVQRRP